MKRKKYIICLMSFILLMIIVSACWQKIKAHNMYEEYRYPNEDFYGKELYSEINCNCSAYETEVGIEIVNKGLAILQYTGTKQDAEAEMGDVDALSEYYYFDAKNAVSQEGTLKFITCKLSGNEGHVWVVYTLKRYDKYGNLESSSSDILSLWYIEKQGNEWHVAEIHEAP